MDDEKMEVCYCEDEEAAEEEGAVAMRKEKSSEGEQPKSDRKCSGGGQSISERKSS